MLFLRGCDDGKRTRYLHLVETCLQSLNPARRGKAAAGTCEHPVAKAMSLPRSSMEKLRAVSQNHRARSQTHRNAGLHGFRCLDATPDQGRSSQPYVYIKPRTASSAVFSSVHSIPQNCPAPGWPVARRKIAMSSFSNSADKQHAPPSDAPSSPTPSSPKVLTCSPAA